MSPTARHGPLCRWSCPALNEADNVPGLLERFATMVERHAPRTTSSWSWSTTARPTAPPTRSSPDAHPTDRSRSIRLSRSFGSHYAISAGLAACSGDAAVVLGADLQEPPVADRTSSCAHWEAGSDVVWGVRRSRVGRSAAQELALEAFSYALHALRRPGELPARGPVRGAGRPVGASTRSNQLSERNRNVLALIAWLGFTPDPGAATTSCPGSTASRAGPGARCCKLAVDSLLQFSSMPLRVCSLAGLAVAAAGIVYAVVLVIRSLVGVATPSGLADRPGGDPRCSAASSSRSSGSWASTCGARSRRPDAGRSTSSATSGPGLDDHATPRPSRTWPTRGESGGGP